MASNSNSTKYPKPSVDQLVAITGVTENTAKYLLSVCRGDLQMAINIYLEDSKEFDEQSANEIRDPIPPQQEVLVEEPGFVNYDNRFRRTVHSVFDSFRDFQVETRRQEEMFSNGGYTPRLKKLEDLFRPPLDLMLHGTFQDARDVGAAHKKWLMVNVQNVQEFSCQILNRDIWSSNAIRTVVKEQFVFWQVYCDSAEGQRYSAFYNVTEWPYVAIIDPRTGECLRVWNKVEASSFCEILLEFLCQHHFDEQPASKRVKTSEEPLSSFENRNTANSVPASGDSQVPECSYTGAQGKKKSIVDADEDEQIAAAIKASLVDSTANGSDNSSSSLPSVSSEAQSESSKPYYSSDDEPETKFLLRYPDGSRENISMPLSAPVKALTSHVKRRGYDAEWYVLVVNFPRRILTDMEESVTLKDLHLHRQETLFIELR